MRRERACVVAGCQFNSGRPIPSRTSLDILRQRDREHHREYQSENNMSMMTLLVWALYWTTTCAAAGQTSADDPTTIRLDVNLVVINVGVSNKDGATVPGLQKQAFQLFVDDAPYPISVFHGEDAPVTVGIVVDNSASMGPKRSEVIAASLAFARSSNPQDQMFVVHFSDRVRFGLPASKGFTASIPELESALSQFTVAGTTALYDALGLALSHFSRATINRKTLIMISDGGDNSSQARLADILQWAQKSGVTFYCIGLFDESDDGSNPRVLSRFAELTGGKAYFPSDVQDTTKICVEIAREIRSQYTLGFAGAEDGKYHRVKVVAQDPAFGVLQVHTRPGYFAAKP
jgi:VWFA-related protein